MLENVVPSEYKMKIARRVLPGIPGLVANTLQVIFRFSDDTGYSVISGGRAYNGIEGMNVQFSGDGEAECDIGKYTPCGDVQIFDSPEELEGTIIQKAIWAKYD